MSEEMVFGIYIIDLLHSLPCPFPLCAREVRYTHLSMALVSACLFIYLLLCPSICLFVQYLISLISLDPI